VLTLWKVHRADQDIRCPGCNIKFIRAAALVAHFEDNQCSEINKDQYTMQRSRQAVIAGAYNSVLKRDTAIRNLEAGSVVGSENGGVGVKTLETAEPLSLLDDFESKRSEAAGTATASRQKTPPTTARSTTSRLSNKHWPVLGSERNTQKEEDDEEDLMKFSELSIRRSGDVVGPSTNLQHQRGTPRVGSMAMAASVSRTQPSFNTESQIIRGPTTSKKWEPNKFRDSTYGHYTCPL
jgi:hypothetical protein